MGWWVKAKLGWRKVISQREICGGFISRKEGPRGGRTGGQRQKDREGKKTEFRRWWKGCQAQIRGRKEDKQKYRGILRWRKVGGSLGVRRRQSSIGWETLGNVWGVRKCFWKTRAAKVQRLNKRILEQCHGPTDSINMSLEPGDVVCFSRKRQVGVVEGQGAVTQDPQIRINQNYTKGICQVLGMHFYPPKDSP